MKIIEVRDGFIKFEADSSICLSSFVQVKGEEKSYIAQVNKIQTAGNITICDAKILFVYQNDELFNYDKTEPSKDSEVVGFTFEILKNSINAKEPVIIGKTLDNACNIAVDASAFDKNILISVDNKNVHNILINNFEKQFNHIGKKVVVIDSLGILNSKKCFAGVDFKLPLNSSSLAFMYDSCLNDATSDSKSTIKEIFEELSEYSKTVPFVPFGVLKSIVDDMVDKQHIFKLLVLKNKLAKYAKMGYFATTEKEVFTLDKALEQTFSVIDLSKLDTVFQNCYLEYIYEKIAKLENIQVFTEVANTISKKNLKLMTSDSNVPTAFMTHSKFQYLKDIQSLFNNFIVEPSVINNEIFKVYSSFLNSMQANMYLTTGEAVNYIPIVSYAQDIDEFEEIKNIKAEEDIIDEDLSSAEEVLGSNEQENELEDNKIIDISEEDLEDSIETGDNNVDIETDSKSDEQNEEYYSQPLSSHSKIIEAINNKSEEAINSVTQNINFEQTMDLFNDEDDEQDEIAESKIEQEEIEESSIEAEEDTVEIEETPEEKESNETIEELTFDEDDNEIEELAEIPETISEESEEPVSNELSEIIEETNIESLSENNNSVEEFTSNDSLEFDTQENIQDNDIQVQNIEENILEPELIEEQENLTEQNVELEELESEELTPTDNIEQEELSVEINNDEALLIDESENLNELNQIPNESLNVNLDDLAETSVLPVSDDSMTSDFDEIVELDPQNISEDDIVVDLTEEDNREEIDEQVEQEIIDDVDKVYTTMKDDSNLEEISDSDLDFIDELNNDDEELEEYQGEELEEVSDSDLINDGIQQDVNDTIPEYSDDSHEILEKKDSSTPIVPVYDADIPQEDIVVSDPIQQGDAVVHAKYGNGVVEKLIKYGNKTLYAINFENIGRRLLDPTLTEIKRV